MSVPLGWAVQVLTAATLVIGLFGVGFTFLTGRGRRLARRFLGIEEVQTSVQVVGQNVSNLRTDVDEVRGEIETVKGVSIAQIRAANDDERDVDLDVVYADYYATTGEGPERYLSDEHNADD